MLNALDHGLRQPLQAMRTLIELMLRAQDPAQMHMLARRASVSLGCLESLLATLTHIAKIESRVAAPKIRSFPVGELLRSIETEFAPLVGAGALKIRVVPSTARALSDPAMLRHMLCALTLRGLHSKSSAEILLGCRRQGNKALRILVCERMDERDRAQTDRTSLNRRMENPDAAAKPLESLVAEYLAQRLGHRIGNLNTSPDVSRFFVEVPRAPG